MKKRVWLVSTYDNEVGVSLVYASQQVAQYEERVWLVSTYMTMRSGSALCMRASR